MNKLCILTSVHPPFDTRIFHKEAKSLVAAGYDVTLIAQHDREEVVDGVRILPLAKPKNRIERMTRTVWQAYRLARKLDADVYHFHDPELIPVGIVLSLNGNRVIYDVHEDLPKQIISKEWIPKRFRRVTSWLTKRIEAFGARYFSAVITTSEKINSRFSEINANTIMVRNYPLLSEVSLGLRDNFNKDINQNNFPTKTVVNLGGISLGRCIKEIVMAAGLLPAELGIKVIIGGTCSSNHLLDEISLLPEWSCVDYRGVLQRHEALNVLQKAKAALILYSPDPNHFEVRSNRLFESMAASVPVITSNFPLWREIIEGNKCGICVDPLNPKEIAAAITWIVEHPVEAEVMGKNGRKAVEERYNWENEEKKLLELYAKLSDLKRLLS